jgi:hypothetical protein
LCIIAVAAAPLDAKDVGRPEREREREREKLRVVRGYFTVLVTTSCVVETSCHG